MRLWSLHPKYLDSAGLVACWREALLAQKVLLGQTVGYTRHPQLTRFRNTPDPVQSIGAFLTAIREEAQRRNYTFDESKIIYPHSNFRIRVTNGQLVYELERLKSKVALRAPDWMPQLLELEVIDANPIFYISEGPVEEWERTV